MNSNFTAQWAFKVHWVVLLIIILDFGCRSNSLQQVGEITYDLKINYSPKFIGETQNRNQKQLYFIESSSAKWLKIGDLNGNIICTKSLERIDQEFGEIGNVNYLSANRILLQKKFSNNFLIIDSSLHIIKHIDLNFKLFDKDSNNLNLTGLPDKFYSSINKKELFFRITPSYGGEPNYSRNLYYEFFKINNVLPYLVRFNDISNAPTSYTFLIDSFYNKINDKLYNSSDLNRFLIADNLIFVNSRFNKYIGVYNKLGEFKGKIEISSNFTEFNYPLLQIDSSFSPNSDKLLTTMRKSGFIRDVFSIPGRDLFVVVAFHKDPKGSYKQRKPRDFSLIIYNSKYKKVCERKFVDNVLNSTMIIDGKIWMYDVKYKENGKIRYKIFDVIE